MLVPHIAGVSPVAFLSKAANAFASRWRCGSSIAARKAATLAVVRCVLFWRIESRLRSPRGRSSNDSRANEPYHEPADRSESQNRLPRLGDDGRWRAQEEADDEAHRSEERRVGKECRSRW